MSIEAMKQALEALEYPLNTSHQGFNVDMAELLAHKAITSLCQAIAEAEGISIRSISHPIGQPADGDINPDSLEEIEIDLPKREWVGLTDDDVFEALTFVDKETKRVPFMLMRFAVAIQAKLKEKNT